MFKKITKQLSAQLGEPSLPKKCTEIRHPHQFYLVYFFAAFFLPATVRRLPLRVRLLVLVR